MELQSGEVRFVLGGSEWDAETDVHDAHERPAVGQTGNDRTDESFPDHERFDHGCLLEFSGEEKDQEIQAAPAGRARWNVARGAGRHRSRPGISEMHRMFSFSGRLPRAER